MPILAWFSPKLKLGVIGRKNTFKVLSKSIQPNDKVFWFHCASLGEYEQGLPVFKALKDKYPKYKIVLSFFSPSGFENKKENPITDIVVYLPLDTKKNAKRFLELIQPNFTIFVKYDIWPNLLTQLKKQQGHAILISTLFRAKQSYFKWYGSFMKKALKRFNHIFTQNEASMALIKTIGFTNVSVSGDTRFDRVYSQLQQNNTIDFISNFINEKPCVVFGSTWPEDDKLFIDYINKTKGVKFIIAPHNIKASYTKSLTQQINKPTVCYTQISEENLKRYDVFILDTIGYLSKVYSYANIAYVGGGAGKTGLHNILEPAVFGVPIIIGKHYENFPEAKALINLGGVISVNTANAFNKHLSTLLTQPNLTQQKGAINRNYITQNKGAVVHILNTINNKYWVD